MPSIHQVLLEVVGKSDDARLELSKVAAEIAAFGREDATAELHIDTKGLQTQLALVRAELEAIAKDDVDIELRIRSNLAIAQLHLLEDAADDLGAKLDKALAGGEDTSAFERQRRSLVAAASGAEAEVAGIRRQAQQQATADVQARARAEDKATQAHIDALRQEQDLIDTFEQQQLDAIRARADEEDRATARHVAGVQAEEDLLHILAEAEAQVAAERDAADRQRFARRQEQAKAEVDLWAAVERERLADAQRVNHLLDEGDREESRARAQRRRDEVKAIAEDAAAAAKTKAFDLVAVHLDRGAVNDMLVQLDRVEERVKAVKAEVGDSSPELRLRTDRALNDVELVRRKVRQFVAEADGGRVRGDLFSRLLGDVAGAVRSAEAAAVSLANIGDEAQKAESLLQGAFGSIGDFAGKTRDVQEAVQAVGIAIVATLIPALIALGASFAAAIAGAGALAAALAASLGPAILLAAAAVKRLSGIFAAKKAQDAEAARAVQDALAATQQVEQAERSLGSAAEQLRNAREGEADAERDLATARVDAAKAIADAQDADVAAQQRLGQATQAVRDAFVSAHREMQDAAERVRDAVLGIEEAELGRKEADLGLKEAQLALKQFRAQAKLAGKDLDSTFKKFEDVDFDPAKAKGFIENLGGSVPGGKDGELDLERLILNVQRAKLNEKQATDSLSDSQRELTRAREDDAKFQREGISASRTLANAIRAQTEATKAATAAHEKFVELQGKGVEGADGVVAAERRVRDAHDRTRAAAQAVADAAGAFSKGIAERSAKAEAATHKLTDAERDLGDAIDEIGRKFRDLTKTGVERVFDGLTDAINTLTSSPALGALKHVFDDLGSIWGDKLRQAAKALTGPEWTSALATISQGSLDIAGPASDAFGHLAEILRNVAAAATPFLVDAVNSVNDSLGHLADKTSDIDKLREQMKPLIDAFNAWVDAITSAGDALLALATGPAGEAGTALVQSFADGADNLARWARSARGTRQIQQFFEDTLPAARELVNDIILLGAFLGRLWELAAPAVTPLLAAIGEMLRILNSISQALIDIGHLRFKDAFSELTSLGRDMVKRVVKGLTNPKEIAKAAAFVVLLAAQIRATIFVMRATGVLLGKALVLGFKLGTVTWRAVAIAATAAVRAAILAGTAAMQLAGGALVAALAAGMRAAQAAAAIAAAAVGAVIEAAMIAGPWLLLGAAIVGLIILGLKNQDALKAAGQWLVDHILAPMFKLWTLLPRLGFKAVVLMAGAIISAAPDAASAALSIVNAIVHEIERLPGQLLKIATSAVRAVVNGLLAGLGAVTSAAGAIAEGILGAFRGIAGRLSGIMRPVVNVVIDVLNGITGAINTLVGFINDIPNIHIHTPLGNVDLGIPDIPKIPPIPRLASGGIATRPTFAEIGDRGREAVLPLTRSVMRDLASQIVMASPALSGKAGVAMPGGGIHIAHQDVHLPPAPAAAVQDARYQAVQFTAELKRRGGGA